MLFVLLTVGLKAQTTQIIITKEDIAIEGRILERKINEYVKIRTLENDTLIIRFSDIQKIYNINQDEYKLRESEITIDSPKYDVQKKESRFLYGIGLGFSAGGNDYYNSTNPMTLKMEFINSYRINEYLNAGMGLGINLARLSYTSLSAILSSDLNLGNGISPYVEVANSMTYPFVLGNRNIYNLSYSLDGVLGMMIRTGNKFPKTIGLYYRYQRFNYEDDFFEGTVKGTTIINRIGIAFSTYFR